jgi:hypothetical protein
LPVTSPIICQQNGVIYHKPLFPLEMVTFGFVLCFGIQGTQANAENAPALAWLA